MYYDFLVAYYVSAIVVAAGLGVIPGVIAKNKGYNFWLWWFYGWMIFIAAIIHVNVIPNKKTQQVPINATSQIPYCPPTNLGQSAADELKKYKELKDQGVVTEEEFQAKKEQLLKLM